MWAWHRRPWFKNSKGRLSLYEERVRLPFSNATSSGTKSRSEKLLVCVLHQMVVDKELYLLCTLLNESCPTFQEVETQLDEINSVREQLQGSEVNLKKELQVYSVYSIYSIYMYMLEVHVRVHSHVNCYRR